MILTYLERELIMIKDYIIDIDNSNNQIFKIQYLNTLTQNSIGIFLIILI